MKVGLIILVAWFATASAFSQGAAPATRAKPLPDVQVIASEPPKDSAINTNLLVEPLVPKKKDRALTYSGVLTDVARATNRWKLFSLRQPVDPKRDGENLMDAESKVGPSIKLFSIGFRR